MKAYYSQVPFCNIHVMQSAGYCETFSFVAGMLETDNPDVIKHLDGICDRPGSGITSKSNEQVSADLLAMQADIKAAAEKAQGRMVASGLATA